VCSTKDEEEEESEDDKSFIFKVLSSLIILYIKNLKKIKIYK
jgi:hypothetical protein